MARDLEVNEEYFRRNYHRRRKVKRTNRIPQLIAGGLAAVTILGAGALLKDKPVEEAPTVSYMDTISDERVAPDVTIDEINALNIIINDGDCNDTFIENICQIPIVYFLVTGPPLAFVFHIAYKVRFASVLYVAPGA